MIFKQWGHFSLFIYLFKPQVSLFSRTFLERLMLRGTQWVFGRADSYYSDRKITKIESTVRCGRADHPSPPLPAPPRPSPPRPAPQRGRHREKERLDRCAAARPETGLPAIFVWIFCRYYSTELIKKNHFAVVHHETLCKMCEDEEAQSGRIDRKIFTA